MVDWSILMGIHYAQYSICVPISRFHSLNQIQASRVQDVYNKRVLRVQKSVPD